MELPRAYPHVTVGSGRLELAGMWRGARRLDPIVVTLQQQRVRDGEETPTESSVT